MSVDQPISKILDHDILPYIVSKTSWLIVRCIKHKVINLDINAKALMLGIAMGCARQNFLLSLTFILELNIFFVLSNHLKNNNMK